MRLNTKKCKILHIPGKVTETAPVITLNGEVLKEVSTYKYLGINLNNNLVWDEQCSQVYSLISDFPYLAKQLKRCGFKLNILVSAYKSLVLSHFNYSSTVLVATSASTKQEMSNFQNRILRILNITSEQALAE